MVVLRMNVFPVLKHTLVFVLFLYDIFIGESLTLFSQKSVSNIKLIYDWHNSV